MTHRWPRFVTKDIPATDEGDAEMQRRWEAYDREMKALIAAGGVHQDDDGWWVDDASGELIGPDPEIERPLAADEMAPARPFKEALPELYQSIQRSRGRPALDNPKKIVSIRLDPDVIDKFKATGKGWQARINAILKDAKL
jgi:uncharacterized protein (DUF4415 family)